MKSKIYRSAGLLLVGMIAALSTPATAQSDRATVERFLKYLASQTYSTFLGHKALTVDEAMPPKCKTRELTGRKLVAIIGKPAFHGKRKVPITGQWLERITIKRCGRTVEHNILMTASKVRGLLAVAGFPGRTRTSLDLQLRVGNVISVKTKRRYPKCRRIEIVNTRVTQRPTSRTDPWIESWTVWRCGRRMSYRIRFLPGKDGKTKFRLLSSK